MSKLGLLALLLLGGCQEPITEVVLVIDSDLAVPAAVDGVQLTVNGMISSPPLLVLPSSLGIVSNGMTEAFSAAVQLMRFEAAQPIVVSRSVSGVRFVDGKTMMLVLRLDAACACDGTSCPNPGVDPDCDNVVNPTLVPFDPDVAPPSGQPPSGGYGIPERPLATVP